MEQQDQRVVLINFSPFPIAESSIKNLTTLVLFSTAEQTDAHLATLQLLLHQMETMLAPICPLSLLPFQAIA